ncbi:MAG: formylglycine-generating enzyme family protein [Bacteroidota bacterium]
MTGGFCFYRKGKVKEEISKETQKRVDGLFEIPDPPKISGTSSENVMDHPILKELGVEMVKVDGGSFRMGGSMHWAISVFKMFGNEGSLISGRPAHEVKLKDFYIGKYPITQSQWAKVMGSNPSSFKGDLLRPVENVSWVDCQNFLEKLKELTKIYFRLPTESEWEFAAKGGNMSKGYTYAGSNKLMEVGWYGKNSEGSTHPVGRKIPNELGIYDMSGNVREWCEDDGHENYKGAPSNGSAWVDKNRGSYRVSRGGSWYFAFPVCRSVHRSQEHKASRHDDVGFRLALSS